MLVAPTVQAGKLRPRESEICQGFTALLKCRVGAAAQQWLRPLILGHLLLCCWSRVSWAMPHLSGGLMARDSFWSSARLGLCRLWSLGEVSTRLQGMMSALGIALHASAEDLPHSVLVQVLFTARPLGKTLHHHMPHHEDMYVLSVPLVCTLLCPLPWTLFLCLATSPAIPPPPPQIP